MNRYRVTRAFQSPPRDGDEPDVIVLEATGAGRALAAAQKQLCEAAEAVKGAMLPPWGWLPAGTYSVEKLGGEADEAEAPDAELAAA